MSELFLFTGLLSDNHTWLVLSQMLIVAVIILVIAKAATSSMQLVPGGAQNVMEAFLEGIIGV
ncbi:MAG: F0F1 ATP synthase subunit A, partial [Campylobacteraceae bacterium]|nr:F0F1 ATP synthase subunit A [Campylobacteraceae bacterium]